MIKRSIAVSVIGVLLALLGATRAAADDPCRPELNDWQRPGYVAVVRGWPERFDVAMLNAGWAVDHQIRDAFSTAMDRAMVIRTYAGYRLDPTLLGPLVDANPGALWLIGSEPDSIWNDNVLPQEYARIYHDLYAFIKGRNAMAQVAAGGIVQPTPLRLAYLDLVLGAYQAAYGESMPVDLWQIHNAILNEQRGSWGADIPPGIDEDEGVVRQIDDNDNMVLFRQQVRAFRQWMADRGYQGYPLIVTEYGVLMPDDYGFTEERVNRFMTDTFAFFATATDPALGDPSDGFRLVQRWAWFSLDVPPWDPLTAPDGFNGNLFDPETAIATAFGHHFASLTAAVWPTLYVDLGPSSWQVEHPPLASSPTESVTVTVRVRVANGGTGGAGSFVVDLYWDGPTSGSARHQVASMPAASSTWLEFALDGLLPGPYQLAVSVDALNQVPEAAECNNTGAHGLVVPRHRVVLPLVARGRSPLVGTDTDGRGGKVADAAPLRWATTHEATAPAQQPGFVEFELPTASSFPGQLILDPQSGMIWATERDGNKLARLNPATGEWTEWDIPTANSQPWGLARDDAGNIWFAESAADKIGKWIAATEEIVEYTLPGAGSQPWGVDTGGGMVWFTERAANRLGRLNPITGAIQEYPLLSAGAAPGGVAFIVSPLTGRDMVWFAETGADKLGQYDVPSGIMREFTTTTPQEFPPLVAPEDVALMTDGNPWLTSSGSDAISLFLYSTLQRFVSYPVRTPGSEPYGIDVYGNSAVWFTERAGNRLGRFGREGRITEYPLPVPGSQPTDVVAESSACAWYAAPGSNRVGHFCRILNYLPLVFK
ncbi:MAG TPA: CARDB domain-containing protein [Anaerolineae bacterium]|nr:CARDB domain-containing protein [Anaerolineae bacterium]